MQLHKIDFFISVIGALLASILSAIILASTFPLVEKNSVHIIFASFVVYFPFCLFGCFLVGIPIFFMLLKMRLVRWWVWTPISFFLGIGLSTLFGHTPDKNQNSLVAALFVSFVSAASFRVVWAISRKWRMKSD